MPEPLTGPEGETSGSRSFTGGDFDSRIASAAEFLRRSGIGRVNIFCHHSVLIERVLFMPFLGRRKISLMLPAELSTLMPESLEKYVCAFTLPRRPGRPVNVFLLSAEIENALRESFQGIDFSLSPLEPSLYAAAGRPPGKVLLLVREAGAGRLVFFEDGVYAGGRSLSLPEKGEGEAVEKEKRLLLRQVRAEGDYAPVVLEGREIFEAGLLRSQPGMSFRHLAEGNLSRTPHVFSGVLVLGIAALILVFFISRQERNEAREAFRAVSERKDGLDFSEDMEREREILEKISTTAVTRLVERDFSPLEGFLFFHREIPAEIPLVLEYIEVDRERLVVRARVESPRQVERIINNLVLSEKFREPVLGQLQVIDDGVAFPLTIRREFAFNGVFENNGRQ